MKTPFGPETSSYYVAMLPQMEGQKHRALAEWPPRTLLLFLDVNDYLTLEEDTCLLGSLVFIPDVVPHLVKVGIKKYV